MTTAAKSFSSSSRTCAGLATLIRSDGSWGAFRTNAERRVSMRNGRLVEALP
ncbi:hypothetical protein [Nonomuraea salmonea]|uniref:hypothetical protein n=1 Tax=Nonomuraea salmonea TaxID=46181 RepID=UPI0031E60A5F